MTKTALWTESESNGARHHNSKGNIKMGKPEGKIENYLVKKSEDLGFLCYKFLPSTSGVPDRILIGYGQTVFVETKRPKGTLRRLQEVIVGKMREHGAIVYVADTKEQIDELLKQLISNKT